ncbi:hypothetical protein Q7P37_008153 [Cladosporium fusiforme]
MNARPAHKRSQSNGLKPPQAHARSTRPAVSSKRTLSYNNAAFHHPHPSAALRRQKSRGEVITPSDTDSEDMAASFLQFCATCERQIVTPSFSILYCSEACRRRDSTTCTPQPPQSPPISPTQQPYSEHPPADILPLRSPTVVRPLSTTFSELNLARTHSNSSTTSSHYHEDDDFPHDHYDDFEPESLDPHVLDLPGYPTCTTLAPRRPSTKRASTATDVPSLIHSPSSSYGTTASLYHHAPVTTRNSTTKSIDLVIPLTAPPSPTLLSQQEASLKSQASTLTSLRIAEGSTTVNHDETRRPSLEKAFRRDSTQGATGAAMGSLRQLFNHDAIRCASSKRRTSRV